VTEFATKITTIDILLVCVSIHKNQKMKHFKFLTAVMALILFTLTACGDHAQADGGPQVSRKITQPVDYGNNIYYFPVVDTKFGMSLSDYLKNHPNLEVITMSENSCSSGGEPVGYFVIFHSKK